MSAEPAPVVVAAQEVERLIRDTLLSLGASEQAATAQARVLVEADLRGRHSHGVQRLPVLAERIRRGLIDPAAEASSQWTADAFLLVDGRRGLGPQLAYDALAQLVPQAQRTGIALAAIRNGSHLGMLAPYVEAIAERGCVGLALTTSEALVHPAGGREALVGTNPIGVALPAAGEPFVLDMATSAISMGEILTHDARGTRLPEGVAVDAEGRVTTDPAAAAAGAISPFGGSKGFALGLAVELLVAVLSGTALGRDVTGTLDVEHPVTKGDVLIVVDPGAAAVPAWHARVGAYLDELRDSPPAAGSPGVAIPGDRARAERARRTRDGIPLPGDTWTRALAVHRDCTEGVASA